MSTKYQKALDAKALVDEAEHVAEAPSALLCVLRVTVWQCKGRPTWKVSEGLRTFFAETVNAQMPSIIKSVVNRAKRNLHDAASEAEAEAAEIISVAQALEDGP